MATFTENNMTQLFVGKSSVALTTGDVSTLNNGEIGIFNTSGTTRLTEVTALAAKKFKLVQGRGTSTPITSDTIDAADVTRVTLQTAVAATEQVDYVGYDGATAASEIEVIASNVYYIRMYLDQSLTSNHGGQYVKHAVYQSPASGATEASIAAGLVTNGNLNFSREATKSVRFDLVSNVALAAAFDFDNTVTVTNGSKVISVATNVQYNTGTPAVVGDYVRLSNNGGTTDVALTSEVYKITAITALEITLDKAYLGASGTLATGGSNNQVLTAASVVAGQAGVKIQGQSLTFSVGKFNYRKAMWKTSIEDFGTTPLVSTAANPGSGTYEQAAELEFFYRGNNGEYFRTGEPNIFPAITDVANETYDIITISTNSLGGDTVTKNSRKKDYILLIPNATPAFAFGGTNDLTDCLEQALLGVPFYKKGVASGRALVDTDLAI